MTVWVGRPQRVLKACPNTRHYLEDILIASRTRQRTRAGVCSPHGVRPQGTGSERIRRSSTLGATFPARPTRRTLAGDMEVDARTQGGVLQAARSPVRAAGVGAPGLRQAIPPADGREPDRGGRAAWTSTSVASPLTINGSVTLSNTVTTNSTVAWTAGDVALRAARARTRAALRSRARWG